MSAVLAHLAAAIAPASAAMAEARADDGPLAAWLAGARHAPRPTLARRTVVCVLADHGVVATGVDLGPSHPTLRAAQSLADGEAGVTAAARAVGAALVVIDAGLATAAPRPAAMIGLGRGPSGDLATGAALTPVEVTAAVEAGAALVVALAESGLDLLGLGGLGAGADLAAAAVIAALTGGDASLALDDGRALVAAGLATLPPRPTALDVLAAVGGADVAVMAGAILAAAATYVPVILDGTTALAAGLVATALAPVAGGYLACAHGGGGRAAAAARTALGLTPVLSLGVGHGEGAGAAVAMAALRASAAAP
jgi:nicotinate-nucleotide--dimethylbenzimidazole phosphoribosyltransferase